MPNKALHSLQSHIGKDMTNSPSPMGKWLNGTFRDVQEGSLVVDFTIREEMTNPANILHGGVAAAMMDEVLGITVHTLGVDAFFATVNLNVDYLAAGTKGEVVTAISKVVRKGKNIVHAECVLQNAEGKLLAKATTNMLKTDFSVNR